MTPECGDDRDSVQHTDAISSNLEKLSSSGNIIASQNFCFYGKNSIQQGRECSATRHRPTGRLMASNDDRCVQMLLMMMMMMMTMICVHWFVCCKGENNLLECFSLFSTPDANMAPSLCLSSYPNNLIPRRTSATSEKE